MSNVIQFPVIAGIEIHTDDHGRFNLNALHRASGLPAHKKPSEWLRSKQVQELVEELSGQSGNSRLGQKVVSVVKGGTQQGTFAHELLATSYAGWISPRFQLQVNQVFLDYRSGSLNTAALPDFNNPAEAARAWAAEFEKKATLSLENDNLKKENKHLIELFQEGMGVVDFVRTLNGVNIQQVQKYLCDKKWLQNGGFSGYKATSQYRDHYIADSQRRWFHPLTREEQVSFKPLLLKRGAARLFQMYLKGELPMKATWNGSYGHEQEAMA